MSSMPSAQEENNLLGFNWWFDGEEAPQAQGSQNSRIDQEGDLCSQAMTTVENSMEAILSLNRFIRQRGRKSSNANKCLTMVDDFALGLNDMKTKIVRIQSGDSSAAAEIPGLLDAFRESLDFSRILSEMKGYRKGSENALAEYIGITVDTLSSEFAKVSEAVRPLSDSLAIDAVSQSVRAQLNAVTGFKFHGRSRPQTEMMASNIVNPTSTVVEAPVKIPKVLEAAAVAATRPGFLERTVTYLSDLRDQFGENVRNLIPVLAAAGLVLSIGGCTEEEKPAAKEDLITIPAPRVIVMPPSSPRSPSFTVANDAPHLWGAISDAIESECGLNGRPLMDATAERVAVSFEIEKEGFTSLVEGMQTADTNGAHLAAVRADLARYGVNIPNTYAEVLNEGATVIGHAGAYNMNHETIKIYAEAALVGYTCQSTK